ncbi:MAG: hypothetical protein HYT72_03905 [Candidatus Aenigmarchaeota archaeon]|nr:hypothetical protein [Candidatus Aenigmarchaeota archaeon]
MKNNLYPAILVIVAVFLVQGEATGQISIGVPEATTTVITTSTIAAVQPLNTEWIIAVVIVAVVYAVKKWL